MFKKLKEKITEEVKISPQRFAEFTQSVSDRLQNSSTSDDNFFSIGDDDANNSVDNNSYGFSSVQLVSPSQERTRKNSTSSLASDVSFLPRYEPGSMYHLQSDLDISASELEDNVSTASSQLGHLSKEQIYSAFQKSQMRYHKYRGRYTDLSRHYKDLERENVKMKGVLVETQDKAIRRVTELKEQCSLEQKAKAHLEGALRDEIDEKNYKIKSLQTKIGLLQNETPSNSSVNSEDSVNNSENLENLTKYLNESRKEIENLNAKIQELKANAIVFQSKEQEYKTKINNLEKEIIQFSEREKENNLNLAQNKMELHNEILLKDTEISNVKRDNENLKLRLESIEADSKSNSNQRMENLQNQNSKLIEKVETLTQKSNSLENELIKMGTFKIEINNMKQKHHESETQITKLQALNEELSKSKLELEESLQKEKENYESQIARLRDDAKKGLLSLEPKIREKIQVEFSEKEEQLREEFTNKIEQLTSANNTSTETQLELFEKENTIKKINQELEETYSELAKKNNAYADLEKNHLELIEDCTKLRDTIANFEKDKLALESYEEKLSRLEAHINTLQGDLKNSQENCDKAEKESINVREALAKTVEQLKVLEEKDMHVKDLENDLELKSKNLEEEKMNIIKQFDMEKENLVKTVKDLNEKNKLLMTNLEEKSMEQQNSEIQLDEMRKKMKSFEMKESSFSIQKNEVTTLELKLKELEETLRNNIELVEKEHLSISKDLDSIRNELNLTEDNSDQFTQGDFKSKLIILKDICSQKNKQYNDLVLKQSDLEQENRSTKAEVELLQSEISNILTCNHEFTTKIKDLENKLNEGHILLEEKEMELRTIAQKSQENNDRISELENMLSSEKSKCTDYLKENDNLGKKLRELEEKYEIILEKERGMELEKTEYNLLHDKLVKLENKYQQLQNLYEEEKTAFEKTLSESKENITELENRQKDQEMQKLSTKISSLSDTIEKQKIELNSLLSKTQQFDTIMEKVTLEKDEALKLEKDQKNQLELQLSASKSEINQKSREIADLKQNIDEFVNLSNQYQRKYEQKLVDITELESKLKTVAADLKGKDQEIYILNAERDSLLEEITTLRAEIEDFSRDILQKGTLDTRLIHSESEKEALRNEIIELNNRIQQLSRDNRNTMEENLSLSQEKEELKVALEFLKEDQKTTTELLSNQISELQEENSKLKNKSKLSVSNELDIAKIQQDFYEIKDKCDDLFIENKSLKLEYSTLEEKCNRFSKIKEKLETQIADLERHYNELSREKQLLEDEIQELKTAPVNYQSDSSKLDHLDTLKNEQGFLEKSEKQHYLKEMESLSEKLTKYKSLDLTNKSSIEFYENELQKMKNQNDKLNRKLDETLVTLNHCAELSTSTEVEYLRNVLYNYMLGKESLVLARVIAAVCKFDAQQTEMILQKEQQKQTLLGQLGLI